MQCRAPTSATTCAGGSPTGAQLVYDAERRLTHWQNAQTNPTSQAWFMYDGSGQRVEQYVSGGSGNHTYYLPGGVEEVTPSGSLIKYYSAGGMLLGLNTAHDASGISYLASDGLGSVSEALSPSGSATGAQLYSPYGGVRYTSGVMPTSKGFTGQYADTASSGLDYYGARYYDPQLGQFTSADTANDGLNRYGYVMGNPETYTDPTGHRINCDSGECGGRPGSKPAPPEKEPASPCRGHEALCTAINGTFHDHRTQAVLQFLLSSPTGTEFVEFLLSAARFFGGDLYIAWDYGVSGGAYTTFAGLIQLAPDLLPKDYTTSDLIRAAGALVHEGVESYYALAYGIRSQASQHMDYVAQWFSGEVKGELLAENGGGAMIGGSAYGQTFKKWQASLDGQRYASCSNGGGCEPENQPELTTPLGLLGSHVAQFLGYGPYNNAMGLTPDMLIAGSVGGSNLGPVDDA